ncbi:unnamed protein product [Linum trigynum]|uniref:Uncharacterized protein n=1 Tax=Linum trigynum TaxID=586398 RepID=A0AAV2G1F6_9ROSI
MDLLQHSQLNLLHHLLHHSHYNLFNQLLFIPWRFQELLLPIRLQIVLLPPPPFEALDATHSFETPYSSPLSSPA